MQRGLHHRCVSLTRLLCQPKVFLTWGALFAKCGETRVIARGRRGYHQALAPSFSRATNDTILCGQGGCSRHQPRFRSQPIPALRSVTHSADRLPYFVVLFVPPCLLDKHIRLSRSRGRTYCLRVTHRRLSNRTKPDLPPDLTSGNAAHSNTLTTFFCPCSN